MILAYNSEKFKKSLSRPCGITEFWAPVLKRDPSVPAYYAFRRSRNVKKPIKLLVLRGNFVNLMLFALLGAPVSPGYAESKAEITTVLEAPGALTNRLLLEREDLRLYFLDRRDPREPDRKEATAGVAAPFFVAGPVEPLGLFRETENPLGYGDASDVFGERTGLGLAANLEVSPRHGVWIQAPRRGFGLGGYGKARDGARFAAASSLEIPGSLEVSGLLQIARPDSAPPAEDWFPEKPSYPGGTLYNLALRLFCPFTLPLAGAARFSLSLGSSRGDRLERGSFLHASASQESGLLKSSFLLGFCEPRYATPSGTFPTGRILGSGTAALLPEALVSPKLRASIKEERQRPLPIPRPPRDEEYGGGVTVKTKTLTVTAEGGLRPVLG